jgi:hypothetical protein
MNRLSSSALVATLLFTSSACAQDRHNRVERAQDRAELRQDKRETRDDRRDVAELEAVLARFDAARASKDDREMLSVEAWLRELVKQELAEGRAELASDKAEVRRDTREVRADGWQGGQERRDDRRDRKDDVRDAQVEAGSQAARKTIARELSSLVGSRRPADLNRTRTLITELIGLGRQEVRGDQQEKREDRRELREDRRR